MDGSDTMLIRTIPEATADNAEPVAGSEEEEEDEIELTSAGKVSVDVLF